MRIKEITVYEFGELAEDVQNKILEQFRHVNTEFDWYDDVFDYWTEGLEEYGFISPKIYFSGFYSQGDGACFDAEIDLDTALDKYLAEGHDIPANFERHERAYRSFIEDYCSARIITTNYHYSHWNCRTVDSESLNCRNSYLNAFFENFMDWLESRRKDFCCRIYDMLEKEYNYLTSDEAVRETLEINEYEFTAIGKIA